MGKDESEMLPRNQDQERAELDYELFLREIEEDTKPRQTLQLYKSSRKNPPKTQKMEGAEMTNEVDMDHNVDVGTDAETDDGADDGLAEIAIDELLGEFDEMNIQEDDLDNVRDI
jgi:nonsense-mediated mRNA decay protein 3